jgi:Rrf2 family protein
MHINATADYAVRAVVELASSNPKPPRNLEELAVAQAIPVSILAKILTQLRNADLVRSKRGPSGGYWLALPAADLDVGRVLRVIDGPLVRVRGLAPEEIVYAGSAAALQQVWVALQTTLHDVLEHVTVAQIAAGELPRGLQGATWPIEVAS